MHNYELSFASLLDDLSDKIVEYFKVLAIVQNNSLNSIGGVIIIFLIIIILVLIFITFLVNRK